MTQFFRDFQSDTVGQLPAGFSEQSSNGNFEVLDLGGSLGKVLAFRFSTNLTERFCWWVDPAGPGQIVNGDMLVRIRQSEAAYNDVGVDTAFATCRIPGPPSSGSSNQMIATGIPNKTTLRVQRIRGYSAYATDSISFAHSTDYYIRMNFNGNTIKSRFWQVGSPEPNTWNIQTTTSSDLDPGYIGCQVYKGYDLYWHWFSVSDDPAVPADNPDVVSSGDEQNVTLPDLNQATEIQTVSVSALAGITGLEVDQDTQAQLSTVAADFGVVTSDADQDTNSQTATVAADITGDVTDAQQQTNGDSATLVTDLDVITTDGEQVTQVDAANVAADFNVESSLADQDTSVDSATVAVDLGVPGTESDQDTDISSGAVAVNFGVQSSQAEQDTSVELLTISTDAITTINLVTAEQLTSVSPVNVSELNTVASVAVQQALSVELMTPAQVGSVIGVPGQSQVQSNTAGVITNVLTDVITADQLTEAQIIDLLDGTGLSVVVVEQGTDFASGDVSIVYSVAVVSSEQGTEGETIRTGAAAVLNVLNIEQMTEAEITDVLGSAMLVNPRSLRVKRTTIGYTVNRKTSAFRVTLKTT